MFSFLHFACSYDVVQLTGQTFAKKVEGRARNEVWFVMMSGADCPACRQTYPLFKEASRMSKGMVNFGYLDVSHAQEAGQTYEIRTVPTFITFYPDGYEVYDGPRDSRSMLNEAASYIPDLAESVTAAWTDSFIAQPSAILFTDKEEIPPLWAAISSKFYSSSIRIGLCRNEDLFETFNIEKVPTIAFFNGTNTEIYKGKIDFEKIQSGINSFFAKKLNSQTKIITKFILLDHFEDECLGGREHCILYTGGTTVPEKFEKIKTENSKISFKWFAGGKLPYPFLKKAPVWMYNPRRDGFVEVVSVEKFPDALDRLIDGSAQWKKRDAYMKEEEL